MMPVQFRILGADRDARIEEEVNPVALACIGADEDYFLLVEAEVKTRLGADLAGMLHTTRLGNNMVFKMALRIHSGTDRVVGLRVGQRLSALGFGRHTKTIDVLLPNVAEVAALDATGSATPLMPVYWALSQLKGSATKICLAAESRQGALAFCGRSGLTVGRMNPAEPQRCTPPFP